jgi:hypothetical protein
MDDKIYEVFKFMSYRQLLSCKKTDLIHGERVSEKRVIFVYDMNKHLFRGGILHRCIIDEVDAEDHKYEITVEIIPKNDQLKGKISTAPFYVNEEFNFI